MDLLTDKMIILSTNGENRHEQDIRYAEGGLDDMRTTLYEYCGLHNDDTLLREWNAEANGGLTPKNVSASSREKAHWKCAKGHMWAAAVYSRVGGCGCPYCSGLKTIPGETDLATTHPELAAQWHPSKNGKLTPWDVSAGSHRKVVWICEKGHEWTAMVNHRTYSDSGCPYCSGHLPIPGETDFATLCPEAAAEWDYEKNGKLTPELVKPRSKYYAWWVCSAGHSYRTSIRTRGGNGTGCPYCSGQKALPGFNDLATKEPKIAAQWYQPLNGDLTPEQVTPGCNKRVYWRCDDGHIWCARIDSRAGPNSHGCPVCAGQVKRAKLAYYDRISRQRPQINDRLDKQASIYQM